MFSYRMLPVAASVSNFVSYSAVILYNFGNIVEGYFRYSSEMYLGSCPEVDLGLLQHPRWSASRSASKSDINDRAFLTFIYENAPP